MGQKVVDALERKGGISRANQGNRSGESTTRSSRFRCVLWTTTGTAPRYKLQDIHLQI